MAFFVAWVVCFVEVVGFVDVLSGWGIVVLFLLVECLQKWGLK